MCCGGAELRVLAREAQEETQRRQNQHLHFSPAPATLGTATTTTADFLKLNNADVSRDSEDSGIGHAAILESPCFPLLSPAPLPPTSSSSSLPAQLARLEPLPVSPNSPLTLSLLSPFSEEKLLAQIQEECRTFDSVLALKLPYTGTGGHLNALMKSYKPLDLVEACCEVRPINLSGDSELALPWDPLASSYRLMSAAQRAIVCLQCPFEAERSGSRDDAAAEKFVPDDAVKTLGGELADSIISMVEGGDVPSIHAAPAGYLISRQVPVPRPAATDTSKPKPQKEKIGKQITARHVQCSSQESLSPLELYIMMRSGKLSPEISREYNSDEATAKGLEQKTDARDSVTEEQAWATSPTLKDVYLNKDYQMILSKVSHYGRPIMESLQAHGLPIGRETQLGSLDPDDVKFFLKQQQKYLVDSQGSKEEGVLLQSCKLAACLYVLVSFADGVANINLATGLSELSRLSRSLSVSTLTQGGSRFL
jgi:hypothetical protein